MSHLPECWFANPDAIPAVAVNDGYPCICDRLRACEARAYALGIEVGKHDGWISGYAAGGECRVPKCDCREGIEV